MLHAINTTTILKVKGLSVSFLMGKEEINILENVSLELRKGEVLSLVGESGSGKSVLGISIIRLIPSNASVSGEIVYKGRNLLDLDEDSMRKIRGREIAWVPQSPDTMLNPTLRIGDQIGEVLVEHYGYTKDEAWEAAVRILGELGVNPPDERARSYPHQLSGGMKQRALLAIGIAGKPDVLIVDEPTKGLDPIMKEMLLESLRRIKNMENSPAILLITHDLEFAEKLADTVAVMYCGQIIEVTEAERFFKSPLHPYSRLLLGALPSKGLIPIPGRHPNIAKPPSGCRFHDRCPYFREKCLDEPPMFSLDGNKVKCWLYEHIRNSSDDITRKMNKTYPWK